jgi:hypothetical protein
MHRNVSKRGSPAADEGEPDWIRASLAYYRRIGRERLPLHLLEVPRIGSGGARCRMGPVTIVRLAFAANRAWCSWRTGSGHGVPLDRPPLIMYPQSRL